MSSVLKPAAPSISSQHFSSESQTSFVGERDTALDRSQGLTQPPDAAAITVPQQNLETAHAPVPRPEKRVLIVDDEHFVRTLCRLTLEPAGIHCEEAANGMEALTILARADFDLLLLDIQMPGMTGSQVCQYARQHVPSPNLKIVMLSGSVTSDDLSRMMLDGVDDYLTKPFTPVQLRSRVTAALRLKDAQDRSDLLNRHLLTVNTELERNLTARDSDVVHIRNALVLALAKMVERRSIETGTHLLRVQRYCRVLAEEAAKLPSFAGQIDPQFIQMVECCAPLHDIGKVGLPDHILLKPGKLDPEERVLMQAHTIIGAETLQEVAQRHGRAVAFLQMAIDIARHHHEHFDGQGYPDRLAGTAIPLAARIVAIADVYDALRSRRVYKPALSHAATVEVITEISKSQFDPMLLQAFSRCADCFQTIFDTQTD